MPISGLKASTSQTGPSLQRPDLFPFRGLVQRLLPLERIRELYRRAQQPVNRSLFENVLRRMRVEYQIADSDLARIPANGAIAGHRQSSLRSARRRYPRGALGAGPAGCKNPDQFSAGRYSRIARTLHFRGSIREPRVRGVEPQCTTAALAWLHAGGMLAMFPSGEVSHVDLRRMEVADPEWSSAACRWSAYAGVDASRFFSMGVIVLPSRQWECSTRRAHRLAAQRISGSDRQEGGGSRGQRGSGRSGSPRGHGPENRRLFAMADLLAGPPGPRIRRRRSTGLQICLAAPQARCSGGSRGRGAFFSPRSWPPPGNALKKAVSSPFASPKPAKFLNLMQELGRLREITFRAAGEGPGKHRDLDRFDRYYKHSCCGAKRIRN